MKKFLIGLPLLALFACGEKAPEALTFDNDDQKLSYAIGTEQAKGAVMNDNDPNKGKYDMVEVLAGIREGYKPGNGNDHSELCNESIKNLFGEGGMDFNEKYLQDGCNCIGVFIGSEIYGQLDRLESLDRIDTTYLFKGFEDALYENDTILSQVTKDSILQAFGNEIQEKMMEIQQKEMAAAASEFEPNRLEGEKFLEENKNKPGVKTTASGLQYEVLKPGKGQKPVATSEVTVHYHGTLIDGTVFDSSVDRGETISFPLNRVIPGWTEGLQLMSPGAKYRFYIPQELAYGANSQPGSPIKPYSMLIFDVELFSFK